MPSNWFAEIQQWWSQLEPLWVFLFVLPFVVVGVAMLAEGLRHVHAHCTRRRGACRPGGRQT